MTFKSLFAGEHGKKFLIVGAAALAVLMLLLSTFSRRDTKEQQITERGELAENAAEIERSLERRLEELIGKIEGAGNASVMVTLDRTSQLIYEKNEKTQTETKSNSEGGTENTARETEAVLAGSSKQPLQTSVIQPKVRGAAVVCGGASDPLVKEKITYTVAKALNIGISKVYVTD